MATLTGIAFLSHQVGSFIGAWGSGLIFDRLGSYDLAWMGAPCYPSIAAWEDEQKAAEPFNRDKAFFIGSFGAREIVPVHPQKEVEKPSVQDRLKRGSSAKAAAPKASTARKKEDPSL